MSKSLKNGLTRAILGKRDESDQSWSRKRNSKKVLLKFLLTRAKNTTKYKYKVAEGYKAIKAADKIVLP